MIALNPTRMRLVCSMLCGVLRVHVWRSRRRLSLRLCGYVFGSPVHFKYSGPCVLVAVPFSRNICYILYNIAYTRSMQNIN